MNSYFYRKENKIFISILLVVVITFSLFACSIQEAYAFAPAVPIIYSGAAVVASILMAWGIKNNSGLNQVAKNLYENAGTPLKTIILAAAAKGVSSGNGVGSVNMGINEYTTVSEYLASKVNVNVELNKNSGVFAPIVAAKNPLSLDQLSIAGSELPADKYSAKLILYEPHTDTRHVIGMSNEFLKKQESPYFLSIKSNSYKCYMRIYMYTPEAVRISFKGNETKFKKDEIGSKYDYFFKSTSVGENEVYRQEVVIVGMLGNIQGIIAKNNMSFNNWGYEGCYVPAGTMLKSDLSCDIKPESFTGMNTGSGANYYVDKTTMATNDDGSISVSIPYTNNPTFDGEDTNIAVPTDNSVDNPITLDTVLQGYESIDGFFEAGGSIILADGTVITKSDELAQTGETTGATTGTQSGTGDIPQGTTWPYSIPILGNILKILTEISEAIKGFFDISDFSLDFEPLKIGLTKKFPFCIPFDLLRIVKTFSVQPTDFNFKIYLDTSYFTIDHTVDLSPFWIPIRFFRWLCVIYFSWILISRTRDLMKW